MLGGPLTHIAGCGRGRSTAARPDVTANALSSIERAGADALSSMRAMVGALRADRGDAPIAPTATLDDIPPAGDVRQHRSSCRRLAHAFCVDPAMVPGTAVAIWLHGKR
jgi:hypothetical protein